jgi:hypothetical protein
VFIDREEAMENGALESHFGVFHQKSLSLEKKNQSQVALMFVL